MSFDQSDNFVAALNQSYRFEGDRIVFQDGVSYTIAESLHIAKDRLDDDDIQAIHLVKKLFDGEILAQPGEMQKVIYNASSEGAFDSNANASPVKKPKSLSSLAFELGPPPLLNGSSLSSEAL